ncbi:hypothetical protein SESBI_16157 [Sesbania bispinosa]|nr:hypothetical protein SESBI_16157 [Sesbania bispinosa]
MKHIQCGQSSGARTLAGAKIQFVKVAASRAKKSQEGEGNSLKTLEILEHKERK